MNASQDPAQPEQSKARGRTRATRQITDEPGALLAHREIRNRLVDCDVRLLSLHFTDSDVKSVDPRSRNRFIASFFDYTNGRMLLAQGDVAGLDIDSPGSIELTTSSPTLRRAPMSSLPPCTCSVTTARCAGESTRDRSSRMRRCRPFSIPRCPLGDGIGRSPSGSARTMAHEARTGSPVPTCSADA